MTSTFGLTQITGPAPVTFTHTEGQVATDVTIEWDFDNDGDFSESIEDITDRVLQADMTTGRDWPSHLTGRASAGELRLVLRNDDDAFNYFNGASPLNANPYSLKAKRLIRVRTATSTAADPELLTYDRFGGSGAPGTTETGLPWVEIFPGFGFTRGGGVVTGSPTGGEMAVDLGTADAYVQGRFVNRDSSSIASLVYRYDPSDPLDIGYIEVGPAYIRLREVVDGSTASIATVAIENRRNVTVGVHCVGDEVGVFLDGVQVISYGLTPLTGTHFGVRASSAPQRPVAWTEFYAWDTLPTEVEGILWTGRVTKVLPRVDSSGAKTVTVEAEGPLAGLSRVDVDTTPSSIGVTTTSVGVTTGLMVGNLLASAGLLHPPGPIQAGDFRIGAVGLESGKAINLIRRFEETEVGFLYETAEGHIGYNGRSAREDEPVAAGFSDMPGAQFTYESIDLLDWGREIFNRVRTGISPKTPSFQTAFGTSSNTGAAVTNDVSVTIPNAGDGAIAGDLLIVSIISSVGYDAATQRLEGTWITPPGWEDLSRSGNDPGKLRLFAKRLQGGDLGKVVKFYDDDGPYGGTWIAKLFLIRNWYGNVTSGVALSDSSGFGQTATVDEARAGTNNPAVLFVPWGPDPSLLLTFRSGSITASAGTAEAAADANCPHGYSNMNSEVVAGSISTADVAVQYAVRDAAVSVENPSQWAGDFGGFDFTETITLAVRGYAGDPPQSRGGEQLIVDDLSSQAEHGEIITHEAAESLFGSTTDAQTYADRILSMFSTDRPIIRVGFTASKSAPLRAQAYRRRVGDKIQLVASNRSGMGVTDVFTIESVRHLMRTGDTSWWCEWELSPTVAAAAPTVPDTGGGEGGGGEVIEPEPEVAGVQFRTQLTLATPGQPEHVLRPLGYVGSAAITRADLDDILDDWLTATGGTLRTFTSQATWNTAIAAAEPGDLLRCTSSFTVSSGQLAARGNLYGIAGTTMTTSPAGGTEDLPIIVTCADGVEITGSGLTNDVPVLDLVNCRHVWAVGFNVAGTSQFGIRAMNAGGSAGFPAYIAYCNVDEIRDAAISCQGWFQLITSSGGTPPAGSGNEWGFSEHFVVESNTVFDPNPGDVAGNPGEGVYLGRGASPGWISYAKDCFVRGNRVANYKGNGYEAKPGCHRVWFTDNVAVAGRAQNGAAFELCYMFSGLNSRPAWMPDDPEIYVEGNRVYDYNITETGTTRNQAYIIGIAGVRMANNMLWSARDGSGDFGPTDDMDAVLIQTEKTLADFGDTSLAPTWVVNNNWQSNGLNNASSVTGVIFRNNIGPAGYNDITHEATSADYVATTPAVGSLSDAEWLSYGPGSAFALASDSDLLSTGVSIADLDLAIDADISQRPIPSSAPNPGPFQTV